MTTSLNSATGALAGSYVVMSLTLGLIGYLLWQALQPEDKTSHRHPFGGHTMHPEEQDRTPIPFTARLAFTVAGVLFAAGVAVALQIS